MDKGAPSAMDREYYCHENSGKGTRLHGDAVNGTTITIKGQNFDLPVYNLILSRQNRSI